MENLQKINKEDKALRSKLARTVTKAGLPWLVYGSIVDYSDNLPLGIDTAVWIFDRKTKKEKILFNKKFLADTPVPLLVIALRHEFLHKAMYRGIKGASNRLLVNIALDAAINKILFLSTPKNVLRLFRMLFPSTSKEEIDNRIGILSVLNPSITTSERNKIQSKIRSIFDEIHLANKTVYERVPGSDNAWQYVDKQITNADMIDSGQCGNRGYNLNKDVPDPLVLYNKIASTLNNNQKKEVAKQYKYISDEERTGDNKKDKKDKKEKQDNTKNENNKEKEQDKNNNEEQSKQNNEEKEEQKNDKEDAGDSEGQEKDNDSPNDEFSGLSDDIEDNTDEDQQEQQESSEEDENDENDGNDESNNKDEINESTEEIGETDYHKYSLEEFGDRVLVRGGKDVERANDKKSIKDEVQVVREVDKECRSNYINLKSYFNKFVYHKEDAEKEGLDDFISKWETDKQIESAINTIYNTIKSTVSIEPIPNELTRTGFELVVLDVCGPDQVPLYFNQTSKGAKKKVCCYFDTSPSMHEFVPYMVSIAEFFANCEECEIAGGEYQGKYCFSEKVQGIQDWDKFCHGEVHGGCGTSFEIVTRHLLERVEQDEVDIALVMTDGLSNISNETVKKFNETGRKCYTIYFTNPQSSYGYNHPRYYTEDKKQDMHSDLDKLDGMQFTIRCSRQVKV